VKPDNYLGVVLVSKAKKFVDLAQSKQLGFSPMNWILNRIRRLIAVPSQQSASDYQPITPADPQQADSVPNSQPRASSSQRTETIFDVKRKKPGVEDSLKDIPGVTDQMLVAFGEHGIMSIEDLAACATDDLDGWSESNDGKTIRHAGILDRLGLSREDCEAIIINARIKAGWIT
jgi:transcription termination/antitermination protein NusA